MIFQPGLIRFKTARSLERLPIQMLLLPVVSLLLILPAAARCQNAPHHRLRSSNLAFEGRAYYGWTLDHHIEMTPYKRHYPSFEVSMLKATYGKTRWEYKYNYPLIGLAYWYSDMGGTRVLGSAHAVFPYINFPLLGKKGFNLFFRLGAGIGYLTRPYDQYDNYRNLAIGSHINGAVNLLFEARWRMGEKLIGSGGLAWVHFSNGAVKSPNYGINIPCITAAMAYRISRENPYLKRKLLPELRPFEFDGHKTLQLDLNAGFGVKDMQATLGVGNLYIVGTLFGNIMWPVSFKSRFGGGFDLSYDASDNKILELRDIEVKNQFLVIKTGLTAAYELEFSRMSIMLNLGSYITGLDKSDGYVYEKLGIRYGFNDRLFTSLVLKAHYARADYITFGIGYRFNLIYY